jgi:hypothetical protein
MKRVQKNDEELLALYMAGNVACMDMLINRYKSTLYFEIGFIGSPKFLIKACDPRIGRAHKVDTSF